MNNDNPYEKLCKDCQKLVGAARYTSPHSNLILTEQRAFSSIMGAADEKYYTCNVCGKEWLHETGSCGMGWV